MWKSSEALLQATEALSSPNLFVLFTLGTDSEEVERCPPASSSSPSRPWYLHLPAGFLSRGSFRLASTCSLGSRVWTAQQGVLRVWVGVLPPGSDFLGRGGSVWGPMRRSVWQLRSEPSGLPTRWLSVLSQEVAEFMAG